MVVHPAKLTDPPDPFVLSPSRPSRNTLQPPSTHNSRTHLRSSHVPRFYSTSPLFRQSSTFVFPTTTLTEHHEGFDIVFRFQQMVDVTKRGFFRPKVVPPDGLIHAPLPFTTVSFPASRRVVLVDTEGGWPHRRTQEAQEKVTERQQSSEHTAEHIRETRKPSPVEGLRRQAPRPQPAAVETNQFTLVPQKVFVEPYRAPRQVEGPRVPLAEDVVVRDLLFVMEGLHGKYLHILTDRVGVAAGYYLSKKHEGIVAAVARSGLLHWALSNMQEFVAQPGFAINALRDSVREKVSALVGSLAPYQRLCNANRAEYGEMTYCALTLLGLYHLSLHTTAVLALDLDLLSACFRQESYQIIELVRARIVSNPPLKLYLYEILNRMVHPLLLIFQEFIDTGILHDPHRETFLVETKAEYFSVGCDPQKVPFFLPRKTAQQIADIGNINRFVAAFFPKHVRALERVAVPDLRHIRGFVDAVNERWQRMTRAFAHLLHRKLDPIGVMTHVLHFVLFGDTFFVRELCLRIAYLVERDTLNTTSLSQDLECYFAQRPLSGSGPLRCIVGQNGLGELSSVQFRFDFRKPFTVLVDETDAARVHACSDAWWIVFTLLYRVEDDMRHYGAVVSEHVRLATEIEKGLRSVLQGLHRLVLYHQTAVLRACKRLEAIKTQWCVTDIKATISATLAELSASLFVGAEGLSAPVDRYFREVDVLVTYAEIVLVRINDTKTPLAVPEGLQKLRRFLCGYDDVASARNDFEAFVLGLKDTVDNTRLLVTPAEPPAVALDIDYN